jgi:hypothetical protein
MNVKVYLNELYGERGLANSTAADDDKSEAGRSPRTVFHTDHGQLQALSALITTSSP